MNLNREEFEVLWKVEHSWENNPDYASDDTNESIKKYIKIFLDLEDKQLLDIHITNNKIDSAVVTHKGLEVLKEDQYQDWMDELKELMH